MKYTFWKSMVTGRVDYFVEIEKNGRRFHRNFHRGQWAEYWYEAITPAREID